MMTRRGQRHTQKVPSELTQTELIGTGVVIPTEIAAFVKNCIRTGSVRPIPIGKLPT
jgi:hypothetical protein